MSIGAPVGFPPTYGSGEAFVRSVNGCPVCGRFLQLSATSATVSRPGRGLAPATTTCPTCGQSFRLELVPVEGGGS